MSCLEFSALERCITRASGPALLALSLTLTYRPFVAFNKLPKLPGNENVPPAPGMVEATRLGLYRAKCYPPILEVIARTRRMRKNHPLLKSVYLLTDGDDAYIAEMRMWLSSEGWDRVWVGSKDVYVDKEDREVGVAVDMEVARRAGVFVGNGVSLFGLVSTIIPRHWNGGVRSERTDSRADASSRQLPPMSFF